METGFIFTVLYALDKSSVRKGKGERVFWRLDFFILRKFFFLLLFCRMYGALLELVRNRYDIF